MPFKAQLLRWTSLICRCAVSSLHEETQAWNLFTMSVPPLYDKRWDDLLSIISSPGSEP